MLTFQDQYTMAQQITGDTSAASLVAFKRDVNEGAAMFLNRLGRKFNKEYKTTNVVADQQYYQFPADVLRISSVSIDTGSVTYFPRLVASEDEWNALNVTITTSDTPVYYYIRGFNEVGIWPVPASAVSSGLQVAYEPQHVDLTQADVTTGSVTVTNGSTTVTHSGTSFTPQMVGRWLQITDGTDGKWYRIGGYTSTSVVTLENYYEGITGSGRSFRIGEISKIPQAYQDAPVYYAVDRYYLTQNDQNSAAQFQARFDMKVKSAKETYGRSTGRAGVRNRGGSRTPKWIDLTPPVTYP